MRTKVRVASALTASLTLFLLMQPTAVADYPCGTLPVGTDGNFFRGGKQLRADTEGIRAFIRTYNPSVAKGSTAWAMLARPGPSPGDTDDGWMQAGWVKWIYSPNP